MTERNWAGTHEYGAAAIHRPATVEELQAIVARAPRIRALGSRHSFTAIADSDELVRVDGLSPAITVGDDRSHVSVAAGVRYGELARRLVPEGLAVHNLASLPHISIAGAVATATHGSGEALGNLATAVRAISLVTSDGEELHVSRGDQDFDGLVVNLGALGVVTRVTLDVVPAYDVQQRVYERLPLGRLLEHFDEIMGSGYSVSVFTRLEPVAEQVWVKRLAGEQAPEDVFGAAPARVERHPLAGMDAAHTTAQLDAPGASWDRLPHFRMDFTPSAGDEIQSEYLLPRAHAVPALEALHDVGTEIRPLVQVCEIRTVARDALWLSPQYEQDTVGVHFTWLPDRVGVERALKVVESALSPFAPRPHWGKLFLLGHEELRDRYERLDDFRSLAERLDPRGAFRNPWLDRHVLGPA